MLNVNSYWLSHFQSSPKQNELDLRKFNFRFQNLLVTFRRRLKLASRSTERTVRQTRQITECVNIFSHGISFCRFILRFHCCQRFVLLRLNAMVILKKGIVKIMMLEKLCLLKCLKCVIFKAFVVVIRENLRAETEGKSSNDVCINIVVDIIVIFVRSHHVIDVVKPRRLVKRHSTRPKLCNLRRQFTSFGLHVINVVCQREIMTQAKANVTADVLLIFGDKFIAWLNYFDAGRGAFPWKPGNNLIRKQNK